VSNDQPRTRNLAAIAELTKAASLNPSEQLFVALGNAYMLESKPAEAAKYANRALKLQPESWSAHLLLARALMEKGPTEDAMGHVQEAMRVRPDDALVIAAYGKLLRNLGRIEEADEQFRLAIRKDATQGNAYFSLAYNHRLTEADRPLIEQMKRLSESGELSAQERTHLEYGLGKAHEDLGEFQQAMSYFERANQLARAAKYGDQPFSRENLERNTEFAIQFFSPALLNAYRGLGSSSGVPVFVVGMMRSGTTLAEQILSSHPQVGGAGELQYWSEHRGDAICSGDHALDMVALNAMAVTYLRNLSEIAPGMQRVVDKMPANYETVGLIHTAFPSAKIIHMIRNPVDTCLSIYATPNRSRITWAHDKGNIVFAYQQYVKLMKHWETALPAGVMLELNYEDLVSNQESKTRELIEFCGLPWDEACLRPESNDRSVFTPSVWQVRQPVYKTSVDRWKRYEPWLGAFAELIPADEASPPRNAAPPLRSAARDHSPDEAIWLYRRAAALLWLHRDFEAIDPLKKAVQLKPSSAYLLKLGELELDHGDPAAGLAATDRVHTLGSKDPSPYVLAARCLMAMGESDQAEQRWTRALAVAPPDKRESIRALHAKCLIQYGEFDRGTEILRQILKDNPRSTSACSQLVAANKVTEQDRPMVERMAALLRDPKVTATERIDLLYGLGKTFDDLGEHEIAWKHFDFVHEIELSDIEAKAAFSPEGYTANMTIRMNACNADVVRELSSKGNPSELPIFVVGMIRSGTTLAEQILRSHPLVAGAGELTHWTNADLRLIDYVSGSLHEEIIREIVDQYLELLRRFAGTAIRVVDKQPGNLTLAGILHIAFPNARIVYMHRTPLDTAVSIWTTRLKTTAPFVHDKENIVVATQQHHRLREHWRKVLPANRFLEVSYEALVTDRENTTRKMLEFCGLPWSEDCLSPERARSSVLTPSNWQVRQPVYDTSINRWRNYERWLGLFRKLQPRQG
jgi:tetratricopeptide (TPR) repeat protein